MCMYVCIYVCMYNTAYIFRFYFHFHLLNSFKVDLNTLDFYITHTAVLKLSNMLNLNPGTFQKLHDGVTRA